MNKTLQPVWLSLGILSVMWLVAEPDLFGSTQFFQWRAAIIQYSGIIAVVLMSLTMVLALRLPFIEQWTRGLDKSYRIHKWLGIGGAALGVTHWLWYQVPKWLVAAGWLNRPARSAGASNAVLPQWQEWLLQIREPALEIGEKGFYLLLVLVVVSLWAAVKYKPFKFSHRLMAAAYLMVAFHSALLMKVSYYSQPIGMVTLAIIALGSMAAFYSLLGLVGRHRRVAATVSNSRYFADSRTLMLTLRPDGKWAGHKAGQFAYLRVAGEEPHPFTIVSSPEEAEIRFLIKELGDFTNGLHKRVAAGDKVELEGPYGKLSFDFEQPQIWIAGGVGIAPFLSALSVRKSTQQGDAATNTQPVHLYYCTHGHDEILEQELAQLCEQHGMTLTIVNSKCDKLLNVNQLQHDHATLNKQQVYFCGPKAFSRSLREGLSRIGMDVGKQFHQELFDMR
ncbi:ferric reductase-like transmembrane domain-containing protein [Enterovibrio paralichthyis]|uniref:ferredoxin reductase family protein n=1 Tax=Enterovibrio paralichthyis TaxID=2853805 RepID=UPI001C4606DB|nr:ferric reductase-like transmembrane domain-containing protein [Enterovibrio paralichthyis]MBV7296400.1 ferric reductase-like transmembrane domain-containing protein [Enterovibrio paralichthyis]